MPGPETKVRLLGVLDQHGDKHHSATSGQVLDPRESLRWLDVEHKPLKGTPRTSSHVQAAQWLHLFLSAAPNTTHTIVRLSVGTNTWPFMALQ